MTFELLDGIKRKLNVSEMSKPAVIGVVGVLVIVAFVVGLRLWGAGGEPSIQVQSVQATASSRASESAREEHSNDADEEHGLFVHVAGAVVNPGLYELSAGARVADAVQQAGGMTEDAAQESVNLARSLKDGEQIIIASKLAQDQEAYASPGNSAGDGHASAPSALVNINTANASELTSLPGIGASTAEKIIADRQANGAFTTIEDLKRVSGIGDKKFESLRELICI